MGLFSKKTVTCERCGKEYQTRITLLGRICDACIDKELNQNREAKGYLKYASEMGLKSYSVEEMEKIIAHRNAILEKYQKEDLAFGEGKQALMERTEPGTGKEEDRSVLELAQLVANAIVPAPGAAVGSGLFVLTDFEKVVVDARDIFAVGFIPATEFDVPRYDTFLCVLFTNDPYVPVFPMLQFTEKKFFGSLTGKKNVDYLLDFYRIKCPDLKYPVQELKELKKQISREGIVNGSIGKKVMQNMISDAISRKGIFDTTRIKTELSDDTILFLREYGYSV